MKPKKYPYLGKVKMVRKELPRFVLLKDTALSSELVRHIVAIKQVAPNQTIIFLRLPKPFLAHEEKEIRVSLKIVDVVKILNQS